MSREEDIRGVEEWLQRVNDGHCESLGLTIQQTLMNFSEQHFLKVLICWLLQDTSIWAKSKQGSYTLGRGRYQQTNPKRITAWFLIHVRLGWEPEITTMYVCLSETSG